VSGVASRPPATLPMNARRSITESPRRRMEIQQCYAYLSATDE
jgi:hypothetical protein